jgi:nitrous oxidase accessory protein NosD
VDSRQQVESRAVNVLQSEGGQVWVQGLQRGDRVIVREPTVTVAGMRVEINEVARVAGAGR